MVPLVTGEDELSMEIYNVTIKEVLSDILADPEFEDMMPNAKDWMVNVLDNNTQGGKKNRAKTFLIFFRQFKAECTEEDERLAYILAWCVEIWQAAALMADDIMDGSETRRGRPCWYKHEEVGLMAINDSFMLENLVYVIFWKYFSQKSYFHRLFKLVNMNGFKTIMGQCMDTRSATNFDIKNCTMENYKCIVKYKTSIYSSYNPVAAAMIMAGFTEDEYFLAVETVTLDHGFLFQVQDDYLDCYGDPDITGKIGTDIIDGKCTWLLVKALELASPEQKIILQKCYGEKGEHDEVAVKMIYDELELDSVYREFEKTCYMDICEKIENLPKVLIEKPFLIMLYSIYRRRC